ncbi:hypothetical protein GGR02_002120 [Anoxybacillus voinovskiensis]|uniref:Hydrolase n=1 Tax=Anoxybacteroides voinovskiense TaxID=230470 RepID=A0A840DMR3_9BACL|nr:Cof-type HAD-IIB family hydrolase [Anoxybacillus voinovskiensis]MBB4074354.1 hypothetical protein [Anoxybacillus voinovskiensis]GGJ69182.1 phosphatase YwpJ [Anoxybacillus voinovskiensis]
MLIALDMDGTLLNSSGRISERNKEAIVAAQKAGHMVAIATGRAFNDARKPLAEAELDCPVIGLNGAVIVQPNGAITRDVPLNKDALLPTLEWVRLQPDIYCEIYTNDAVYVGLHNREHLVAMAASAEQDVKRIVEKQFQQARVTYVPDIREIWNSELVFYKILIFSLRRSSLEKAAQQFHLLPDITVTSSHPHNIEINHRQATKGEAVKQLAATYGIDLKKTMVIGDSLNDLPMFAVAGYRVAMGNAAEEVKQQADFITITNDEDGVAHALEKLVGQECLVK